MVIGVFAFNSALGSLGTHSPALNASMSLFFLLVLYFLGSRQFPPLLKELRKKQNKMEHEEYLLEAIEIKFLGKTAFIAKYGAFTIGFAFLGFVIILAFFFSEIELIKQYLYGG